MPSDISRNTLDFAVLTVVNGEMMWRQFGAVGNTDARLTDARPPLPHTHAPQDITGLDEHIRSVTASTHASGSTVVEVDFGTGSGMARQPFAADWIRGGTRMTASPFGATPDHDAEDAVVEQLSCTVTDVGDRNAILIVHAPWGTHGRYTYAVTGTNA